MPKHINIYTFKHYKCANSVPGQLGSRVVENKSSWKSHETYETNIVKRKYRLTWNT